MSSTIFLLPNPSVKEDFTLRPTAAAAFTADCSSLFVSNEIIPGLMAQWTARIFSESKLNPAVAHGLEEPTTCNDDNMSCQ